MDSDEAAFDGTLQSLEPSWSWPKPAGDILLLVGGGSGPKLLRHLFEWEMVGCRSGARKVLSLKR